MEELKEKVKSMTANEIIMAMVESLRNPETVIDMSSSGNIEYGDGVCYGCAATNTICKITGLSVYGYINKRTYNKLTENYRFLSSFENSIDYLRMGDIKSYNLFAYKEGYAKIKPKPGLELPYLKNDYTELQLLKYVELANYQESAPWKK